MKASEFGVSDRCEGPCMWYCYRKRPFLVGMIVGVLIGACTVYLVRKLC